MLIPYALNIFFFVIIPFLIGSIPFGVLYSRWLKKLDPRNAGSGNIGATNVARVAGFKIGLLVLLSDFLKGFLPIYLISQMLPFAHGSNTSITLLCGLSVFLGHTNSIFLGFKGGKGVAVALGIFSALTPLITVIVVFLWLIIVVLTRYVSLASIISGLSYLFISFFWIHYFKKNNIFFPSFKNTDSTVFCWTVFFIIAWIIYKHRDNIKRLFKGEEYKFSFTESTPKLR